MTGTFTQRITDLQALTGHGQVIDGFVTVDQRYAKFQHESADLQHPRGGGPFYLLRPLMNGYRDYLADYARTVLADGGQPAMRRSMEHLSDAVEDSAPREWGDLMKSGHPQVVAGSDTVYDRAPKVGRLTEEKLKAKSLATMRQRIAEGLTVYFTRHGKVIEIPGRNEPHDLRGRL